MGIKGYNKLFLSENFELELVQVLNFKILYI